VNLTDERRRPSPQAQMSVLAPPGAYTVALETDGETRTQPLRVIKDPNTSGTEAEIRSQIAMLETIREDMSRGAETINQIELLRRQLQDLGDVVEGRDDGEEITAAADSLEQELIAVEGNLIQLRVTGTGQDNVRWPVRIIERLGYLGQSVAVGDFVPTDAVQNVHVILQRELADQIAALEELVRTRVAEFNQMLRSKNVSPLIS
jgi:hypothetical protein